MPDQIPLWFFIVALGAVLAISIAAHAYVIYRFRVMSLQITEHKGVMQINTFTMKSLNKTLLDLFGKPANGG